MERDGLTNKTLCIKEFALCEWIMKWMIQETQNEQLIFKYEKRNAEKGINKSENSTYLLIDSFSGVWIIFGSWCWGHTGNSTKRTMIQEINKIVCNFKHATNWVQTGGHLTGPVSLVGMRHMKGQPQHSSWERAPNEGAGNREETEKGVQKTPHVFLSSEKT